MKFDRFDLTELQGFRTTQRLAYDCAQAVEARLRPGMTEIEACRLMKDYLTAHGISQMFHEPFAWFGDRTAFRDIRRDADFLPTERKLEKGMPVILDLAPIHDGYAADIGLSTSCGDNEELARLQRALLESRDFILQAVRGRNLTFRQIYRELDGLIASHGLVNVHRIYPERVLAHRVFRYEHSPLQRFLQRFRLMGFGLPSYVFVLGTSVLARLAPRWFESPLWNDGPESDHLPSPGLWAVEPHVSTPNYRVGAKWEEILVVTDDDAYWLDDEVPHRRRAVPHATPRRTRAAAAKAVS